MSPLEPSFEAPPAVAPAPAAQVVPALQIQVRRGANWYLWIAGVSAINSVAALTGGNFHFILGLGVTQLIDGLALALRSKIGGTPLMAGVLDVLVIGTWVVFAAWGRRGKPAAFYVGMTLFALDGLLLVLFGDWLGVAFHAFAIFGLYGGLRAAKALRALTAASQPG